MIKPSQPIPLQNNNNPRVLPILLLQRLGRTSSLGDLIFRFKQGDDEPIKSAWIRFLDLFLGLNQIGNLINSLNFASTLSPKKRGGIELKRFHEDDECKQNDLAKQVCLSRGDIYDDPSLLRFYQNDDTPPWGNKKCKEKGEDGPKWTIRSRFEDELTNFMLEKKSHTKVLEIDEDELVPIILRRPFLTTARAVIDVHEGKLSIRVESETITFNIRKSMKSKHSRDDYLYCADQIAKMIQEQWVDTVEPIEPLEWKAMENILKPPSVKPPKLELRELPEHLDGPSGGHHGIATTARKVFEAGFYWPHIFHDAHEMRLDAYESSISYKERKKRWHAKRIKAPTNYERGDQDMKNDTIELYDEDGNKFIINKQRVKPYQKSVLDTNRHDNITLDDEGEVTQKRVIFDEKKLLRKFHWIILGGQFNQLSHVSSPLLSKPQEY
uniref:Reverse transcriptase domain-containing protein n=1 Tax=Tanacetum cinerariifolium TaxID=118510 RepID=A0A6L2NDD0_TANCI|nr:hypothetical protein [Tanacetum cinerariifolium]